MKQSPDKQSPAGIENILERITDAFVALDSNWCYTYMNKKAAEIFNREPAEMIGKHIWTEFPEGIDQPFYKAYHQAMDEQQYVYLEEYYPPYEKWFENHIYPSPDGLSIFFRDITDRKKTRKALKDVNQQLLFHLDKSPLGYIEWDSELFVRSMSQKAEAIFGWQQDEFKQKQKNGFSLVYEEDVEEMIGVATQLKTGAVDRSHVINRNKTKAGKIIWCEWFNSVLKDKDGKVITIMSLVQDITERKNTEQQLAQSENRLRTILEAGPECIKQLGFNGELLYMNPAGLAMIEADSLDLLKNKSVLQIIKQPHRASFYELLRNVFRGQSGVLEFEIEGLKGTPRLLETHAVPLRDEHGKIISLLGVTRDITQRKQAENDLKFNEQQLSVIYDTTAEPLFLLDVEKNNRYLFVSANQAFFNVTGLSKQQVVGKYVNDIIPQPSLDIVLDKYGLAISNKETLQWEETTTYPTGTKTGIVSIAPVMDDKGNCIRLVGAVHDITGRKQAEGEIENNVKQLKLLTTYLQNIREEERKRIGREIHDDFGQQLTAIKMDVAWIDKKTTDQSSPIKSKLKNIINLLDGTNLAVRKILNELRADILDNYGLLDALRWLGQQFTTATGIPVLFNSSYTELNVEEATATCIYRTYQEALTNITRYANASTVISSLTNNDEYLILNIKDDGDGFDMEQQHSKPSFGLLGMKERVAALHGTFELQSSPGNGTSLIISLPFKM